MEAVAMETKMMLRVFSFFLVLSVAMGPRLIKADMSVTVRPEADRPRIRVVTIQKNPYIRLKWQPGVVGNELYEGYYVDLFNEMAHEANFDFQLQLASASGRVGVKDSDGIYDGMLGDLQTGSAEIALSPLIATEERKLHFSFSDNIDEIFLSVVVVKPAPGHVPIVNSVNEIVNKEYIEFGVIRNSETAILMEQSEDKILSAIWNKIKERPQSSIAENIYDGLERVRRENFVLIMDKQKAEYYTELEPCDLQSSGSYRTHSHYSLAMKHNLGLVSKVNAALRSLKQDVIRIQRIKSRWWTFACTGSQGRSTLYPQGGVLSTTDQKSTDGTTNIRITTMIKAPYVMQGPKGLEGYIIDLVGHISRIVPFTIELHLVRDGKGIGRRTRGTAWDGMIGELLRGEADFAAAPFVPRKRERKVLSFTKPFLHSTMAILIRVPRPGEEIPVMFMEDLLNQTKVKFGVIKGSRTHRDLQNANGGILAQIWERIYADKDDCVIRSLHDALHRVRRGTFALILQSTESSFLAARRPCDLMSLDQFLSITNYMFGLKKGNDLTRKIDDALLLLQQQGELQNLFHKWWNNEDCMGVTDVYGDAGNHTTMPTYAGPDLSIFGDYDEDDEDDEMYIKERLKNTLAWSPPVTPDPLIVGTTEHRKRHRNRNKERGHKRNRKRDRSSTTALPIITTMFTTTTEPTTTTTTTTTTQPTTTITTTTRRTTTESTTTPSTTTPSTTTTVKPSTSFYDDLDVHWIPPPPPETNTYTPDGITWPRWFTAVTSSVLVYNQDGSVRYYVVNSEKQPHVDTHNPQNQDSDHKYRNGDKYYYNKDYYIENGYDEDYDSVVGDFTQEPNSRRDFTQSFESSSASSKEIPVTLLCVLTILLLIHKT